MSNPPGRSSSREKLLDAAADLISQGSVHELTLEGVAAAAGVTKGGLIYHFKTKDELVGAVVESYVREARDLLAGLERHRSPRARLKGLVRSWEEIGEAVARHGCPIGSLCAELGKRPDEDDAKAPQVFALIVDWAEEQLVQLGRRDARDLAITLIAGIQGAALLTNAFRDPQLMVRQSRQLERWIDTLASPA